jgi:hypothetical protein
MLGDNFACVTGMAKMTGSFKGKEFTGGFRAIDIFEKKNDKWQAITSQVTRVKKEGIISPLTARELPAFHA